MRWGVISLLLVLGLAMSAAAQGADPPFDLKDPAFIARGRDLFNRRCAGNCHGLDGRDGMEAPTLTGKAHLTPWFVYNTLVTGRPGTAMPELGGPLFQRRTLATHRIRGRIRRPGPVWFAVGLGTARRHLRGRTCMVAHLSLANPRPVVPWRPRQVWIDRQVINSPVTANVLAHLPDVPTDVIDGPPPVPVPTNQAALMTSAKKSLYLTAQKGHFVRACPGATSRNIQSQLCCGYMIVDLIYNCNYDCTYCYLQSYVNAPYLTVYANVEQLFDELGTFLRTHPQQLVRIGSGEFSDSLSLDPLTGFSRLLVPFVRQFPNVLFEFKTKSDLVDDLLELHPDGKVMVSWSINPEPVVQREEHKTASLAARLRAAQRCRAAGYKIGLHFDPLLYYPGWEADYEPFVAQVFSALAPEDVTCMSMGSLRFPPALKEVVRERFPKSRLMYAELVPGTDGKMRYFKPLRTEMYTKMFAWIRRYTADTGLYLCMESQEIWQKVFGHAPACSADVEQHIQGVEQRAGQAVAQVVPLGSVTLSPRAAQ